MTLMTVFKIVTLVTLKGYFEIVWEKLLFIFFIYPQRVENW